MGAISGLYSGQNCTYWWSSRSKNHLTPRGTALRLTHAFQIANARDKVHETDAKIGAKFGEADTKLHQLAADGKQATKDTGRELKETADKFDNLVEKKASEAKSGISSWFGFGK